MSNYICEKRVVIERQQVENTERKNQKVGRIGHAINLAIERFVSIGEVIAEDNVEIKEIFNYCKTARDEGKSIERLCELSPMDNMNYSSLDIPMYDRNTIMTAAKGLLSSITRILLLVDIVVVKQLLSVKKKNCKSIRKLESVVNFTEFVQAFSLFGIEMIELAYLMGTKPNKIKEERRKAQMISAKQIVDHSIAILLTSSKTSFLHYDCVIAKENRDTVFCQIRRAMDLIHFVVKDCIYETPYISDKEKIMYSKNADRDTVFEALKYFTILLESFGHQSEEDNNPLNMGNNNKAKSNNTPNMEQTWNTENNKYQNLFDNEDENKYGHFNIKNPAFIKRDSEVVNVGLKNDLLSAFDKLLEKTHDFTDSAYTSHENREHILIICDRCKTELNKYLNTFCTSEQYTRKHILDSEVEKVICTVKDLIEQLIISVVDQVVDLNYSLKSSVELVKSFHLCTINQDPLYFQECSNKFNDHCDHIADVCKLLKHIAFTEALQVQAKCLAINLRIYGPQVVVAAKIVSKYPSSTPANENMDAFAEMWKWLTSEITCVAQQILDSTIKLMESKSLKKHQHISRSSTTSKDKPDNVACATMETQNLTNELAPYNEKWNDELNDNNDIIKRAKNMSAMAFAMYQFTKGNGTLRTTQDLFTQAEYFAEEANRLYKVLRQFSYQVPASQNKKDLLNILDRVPTFVQTLQFTVKDHTVGKDATFVKVDHVLRETKNLMSVINKVVTRCFECANKYKLDLTGLSGGMTSSGTLHGDDNSTGGMGDSKCTTNSTEGSI